MPRVCVIGSANLDLTVKAARLPRAGETVSEGELLISHGGKGANQAVAAKRLGAEVRLIAALGRDEFGDRIAEHLIAEGLPGDRLVRVAGAATGVALIVVDAEGQNQVTVAPGANRQLTVDLIRGREEDISWADVLLLQLETPLETIHWALDQARRHRVLTILNPAPFRTIPAEIIHLVDLLTPNERELEALAGVSLSDPADAWKGAECLQRLGFRDVVITLGARGAFYLSQSGDGQQFSGCTVEVVDTTAAGDAFNGALAVGLASGSTPQEAIPLANAAGALACTRRGAQDSLPQQSEVDRLLRAQV